MNIKVCGITQAKQLQQLETLNMDYAGLNFCKNSPQFIGDKLKGAEIKKADFDLKKVGVFENPDLIDVLDAIDEFGLDVVQLNGNETAEMCDDISSEVEVIKAFRIDENVTDIDALVADYDAVCDYYLFEAANAAATGLHFDWEILRKAKIEKPFFISGGIGVEDTAKIKKFNHLDFLGVDINQKFEKEPGIKDMGLLLKFREAMK
ncbi:MAG: phosphoribosylanthranilate isomerase [Chitinophagaceae bacterium]|nr:phosphoribosylanthranilate isomerase [Chitinophagaceae bacterium]